MRGDDKLTRAEAAFLLMEIVRGVGFRAPRSARCSLVCGRS